MKGFKCKLEFHFNVPVALKEYPVSASTTGSSQDSTENVDYVFPINPIHTGSLNASKMQTPSKKKKKEGAYYNI